MGEHYQTKVFRSNDSLVLGLPDGLEFADGDDVKLVPHADGSFSLWRERDAVKVLNGLYGAFSPGFMSGGRGDIEQEERDWSRPDRDAAA